MRSKPGNVLLLNAFMFIALALSPLSHVNAFLFNVPEIQSYLRVSFGNRSQNWSVSQNPENKHLFLASSDGLMEFNGITWKRHPFLGNQPLRSVMAHTDGRIYTGAFEEFGYWQYNENGDLVYHSLSQNFEVENNDEIWRIFSHNNKILFQSFTTIYIFEQDSHAVVRAPYTMLFMHQMGERLMVQIIDHGLLWYHDEEFHLIEDSELFSATRVHAVIPYNKQKDQWLICTDNMGLFLFDGEEFSYFESEASSFLKSFTCNTAKQLNDSTFAFGSILNGVIITDEKGIIQRRYNSLNGLNNNTVLCMHLDYDNGLWIGQDEGVNYINMLSPNIHYQTIGGSLGSIYAMLIHENHLYIGTNHGLFRSEISHSGSHFQFDRLEFIEGSQGQVWTLELFDDQIVCGHNDGTFLVEGTTFVNISPVTGGWTFKPFREYLIGGTYTGIIILEKGPDGKWQQRNKIENFQEPVRYLETDYLGFLWASHHQKGVFKIELSDDLYSAKNTEHFDEFTNRNTNVKTFSINNRVVFTTGENIYTWDFVRNQMVPFEVLTSGLGDYAAAKQIIPHTHNAYWFVLDNKMALFEVNLEFSPRKILETPQLYYNLPQRRMQLIPLNHNTILIPNPKSFVAFNMHAAEQREPISRLSVDKLTFYGRKDTLNFFRKTPERKIASRANNLTVYFSDPSNFEQFPRNYYFRIKELEASWQSTLQNHFTYLDLKHGKYTLEITHNFNDIVSTSFAINKPWHISNTAMVLYGLILIAAIYGGIEFFRFEISRQRELAAMEIRQNSLEKELDYKSYELMLTMRHLLLKDSILKDLNKQINQLKEQSSKYPVKQIKTIEKIIQQGIGTQTVEWENAMNNLKLSQQGFFKALKEKYPSLTTNDLRLCSYLRMNFNTKEIAQLLNVSPRGVEVSRHRLRKKLNLHPDDNLVEFLMKEEFNLSE